MQFRTLQITHLSGKNLPSEKMPIYAAVCISGETDVGSKQYTKPSGSANPTWKFQMEFKVGETALWKNSLTLEFRLLCNAADDKEVVVCSLDVSVKQLLGSRKSPYVGSVSGEDGEDAGELTFSYKFIDESAPNASGSGQPGWKAAANGAGVAINAAGLGMKAAADVAVVGIKAAANGANEAALAVVKVVKNEKVESGGKDGKKKDVEAWWWERWANKRNEKEKEKAMKEKMNAVRNLPAQQAPASSKAGPSDHQNSASTNNAKTQQNTGLRTGEATGTFNHFQTLATKYMPTDLGETFFRTGGRKD